MFSVANEENPEELTLDLNDPSHSAADMEVEDTNEIDPGGQSDDGGNSAEDDSSGNEEEAMQPSL